MNIDRGTEYILQTQSCWSSCYQQENYEFLREQSSEESTVLFPGTRFSGYAVTCSDLLKLNKDTALGGTWLMDEKMVGHVVKGQNGKKTEKQRDRRSGNRSVQNRNEYLKTCFWRSKSFLLFLQASNLVSRSNRTFDGYVKQLHMTRV